MKELKEKLESILKDSKNQKEETRKKIKDRIKEIEDYFAQDKFLSMIRDLSREYEFGDIFGNKDILSSGSIDSDFRYYFRIYAGLHISIYTERVRIRVTESKSPSIKVYKQEGTMFSKVKPLINYNYLDIKLWETDLRWMSLDSLEIVYKALTDVLDKIKENSILKKMSDKLVEIVESWQKQGRNTDY